MPDYQAMYQKLFESQTQAIKILQEAQQATEEMYVSASNADGRGDEASAGVGDKK